jgi:hypothetical protein
MRKSLLVFSAVAVSSLLLSCAEGTAPLTQEEADELLATAIAGVGVDPNSETAGGHTGTLPTSGAGKVITCSIDAATKTATCTHTDRGFSISREIRFFDGAGNPQSHPDTSTRSMSSKTTVSGTGAFSGPNGATGTTTVNRVSNETVTGLGPGSTQRVVNGTAAGTENTTATDSRGTVTVARTYADTTFALTLPSPPTLQNPWPVSGRIVRNMTATVTLTGSAPKNYSSLEEQTFAPVGKLTIKSTMNGVTRTCEVQLGSRAKPVCTAG